MFVFCLSVGHLAEPAGNRQFLLTCQAKSGGTHLRGPEPCSLPDAGWLLAGFSKLCDKDCDADLLHAYMSLAGLSLMGLDNLQPINPALNMTLQVCSSLPLLPVILTFVVQTLSTKTSPGAAYSAASASAGAAGEKASAGEKAATASS